jgi:hypothetical protein
LREDVADIGGKNRGEQENDVPLSEKRWFVTAKQSTSFWALKT